MSTHIPKTLTFTEDSLEDLEVVRKEHGLSSDSAAIRFLLKKERKELQKEAS